MAYKNRKKNRAHVRALHKPIKNKRRREMKDKERKEFLNRLRPPVFMPKHHMD